MLVFIIPAAFVHVLLLVALGYVDCSWPTVAVVIMTVCLDFSGFKSGGNDIEIVNIAQHYAGLIYSIDNRLVQT